LAHGEPQASSQLQQAISSVLGWNVMVARWVEKFRWRKSRLPSRLGRFSPAHLRVEHQRTRKDHRMILPRMRLLTAFVLLCLPASLLALSDDGLKHTVPPNQQHGAAQASLAIHLRIAPAVLPPRHKDRDHDDKDRNRGNAAVLYNLFPSEEKFSTSRETRTLLVEGGPQPVQLTTLVMK
jgi:hypothetical protein